MEQKTTVTNPKLVEAITEMRKEFTPQTQNAVINESLRATFLLPAKIEKDTQLVADGNDNVKFVDKPKAKFLLIKNKDGVTFFPAFTDKDEMDKFKTAEPYQIVKMKFGDVATLVEQVESIEGFVINPMSHNLPYTKKMLAEIKATLARHREEMKKKQEAAAQSEDAE